MHYYNIDIVFLNLSSIVCCYCVLYLLYYVLYFNIIRSTWTILVLGVWTYNLLSHGVACPLLMCMNVTLMNFFILVLRRCNVQLYITLHFEAGFHGNIELSVEMVVNHLLLVFCEKRDVVKGILPEARFTCSCTRFITPYI